MEGGITRLLAIYASAENVPEIGPVRSARPYFLDWALETRAVLSHVGGSPDALSKISSYGALDLNEYYNTKYFWRDGSRFAPHNVYTSSDLLERALTQKFHTKEAEFVPWLFKDDILFYNRPESQEIEINFSLPAYQVRWVYSREHNDYLRYQDGEPQKDADGRRVRAKNIVVQYTDIWIIDSLSRRKIETAGSGKALVFLDGRVIEGSWEREAKETNPVRDTVLNGARTRFYDERGEEIRFNAGATWVEVVSKRHEVIY